MYRGLDEAGMHVGGLRRLSRVLQTYTLRARPKEAAAPRTSEKTPEESRSVAGGENTACEAHAYTSRAPSRCSTLAALVMVPAKARDDNQPFGHDQGKQHG